MLIYLVIAKYW